MPIEKRDVEGYLRSGSIMGEAVLAAATAGAAQVEIVVFKEAVSISHAR